MDKASMEQLLNQLPLRICMNNGREYIVNSDREILNADLSPAFSIAVRTESFEGSTCRMSR